MAVYLIIMITFYTQLTTRVKSAFIITPILSLILIGVFRVGQSFQETPVSHLIFTLLGELINTRYSLDYSYGLNVDDSYIQVFIIKLIPGLGHLVPMVNIDNLINRQHYFDYGLGANLLSDFLMYFHSFLWGGVVFTFYVVFLLVLDYTFSKNIYGRYFLLTTGCFWPIIFRSGSLQLSEYIKTSFFILFFYIGIVFFIDSFTGKYKKID